MSKILKINPHNPEAELISNVGRILQNGGVIGYPTETIYGIGCDAFNRVAVNRIYALKNRDHSKAMILIAADILQVRYLVEEIPESAKILADNFWPGPLTMVFLASTNLQDFAARTSKTIAIRIPDYPICLALLKTCGFPIVSTSANISNRPAATTAHTVYEQFGDQLDCIVDGGPSPSDVPSTVIDITKEPVHIIRKGAISSLEINTVLETI